MFLIIMHVFYFSSYMTVSTSSMDGSMERNKELRTKNHCQFNFSLDVCGNEWDWIHGLQCNVRGGGGACLIAEEPSGSPICTWLADDFFWSLPSVSDAQWSSGQATSHRHELHADLVIRRPQAQSHTKIKDIKLYWYSATFKMSISNIPQTIWKLN
jgi:hypothetical protein